MITKTIMCPNCKNKVTIQGNPGEKIYLTCSKCNNKGIFTFSEETTDQKTINETYIIEFNNLTKFYGAFKAVDNLSFNVKKGEIFGFLGPNGAGKTTTINMLTTILRPTKGSAKIYGYDILKKPLEAKKHIGFMPDVPGFYGEMKAEDVLDFYAEFYRIPKEKRRSKIHELLDMLQLTDFKKKKVRTFSRGMKQKLGFATSLLNDPELLILDEPTVGLDPATIHFFRNLITSLNKNGVTVFLSSHILSEVQAICNRVGIIDHGKIIAVDSIDSLSAKVTSKRNKMVMVTFENMTEKALKAVQVLPDVVNINMDKEKKKMEIEIKAGKNIISIINQTLMKHGIRVTRLESKEANLEDIFLSLVGESQT